MTAYPLEILRGDGLGGMILVSAAPEAGLSNILPNINTPKSDMTTVRFFKKDRYRGKEMEKKFELSKDSGCEVLGKDFQKRTKSFQVHHGCCTFYKDKTCSDKLFTAKERWNSNLKGKNKKSIISYRCNYSGLLILKNISKLTLFDFCVSRTKYPFFSPIGEEAEEEWSGVGLNSKAVVGLFEEDKMKIEAV
ncbi:hypothetical protein BZA77DRAFT_298176 [Pyronema omphalodes]|nr:hypothetical protein BZA77DRAFT_298176 [Pyronema omphalodes]